MTRAELAAEYDAKEQAMFELAEVLMDLPPVRMCRTEYSVAPLGCLCGIAFTLVSLWVLILWPIIEFLMR